MTKLVSVGFLVAYDWYYLKYSLPLVYEDADRIILSIDKDRVSWAGESYHFDEQAFQSLICSIDKKNKIILFEEDFHLRNKTPMQNEIRQRTMMAERMGNDVEWFVQLDADEYFLDFKGFVSYLKSAKVSRPVNICCPWYTMYKEIPGGYLFIRNSDLTKTEFIPIATNRPLYEHGRTNGHFNIKTGFTIVHQSWARDKEEILQKISNWGHKGDFDVLQYFQEWNELDGTNFQSKKDLHPVSPGLWEGVEKVEARNVDDLIHSLKRTAPFIIPDTYLKIENSIWVSRARALWSKIASQLK